MLPYFFNLETSLFSFEEKDEILEIANKNRKNFIGYVSKKGFKDGNDLWKGDELSTLPCIKNYLDSCNIEVFAMLVRHAPGITVIKHIDEPNRRNCAIATPIRPFFDYSPTYYFSDRESVTPIATATFPNLNSCLLNTQEVHALRNYSKETRINVQLAFNESFDVVCDLIKNNRLFKTTT
jgi:hypothetical protein